VSKCVEQPRTVGAVDAKIARKKCVKEVSISGRKMDALIDTGSDISLMRAEQYVRVDAPKLGKKTIRFRGIGAENNKTLGEFDTVVNIDERDYPMHVHVVAGDLMKDELILGIDFLNTVQVTMSGGKVTIRALESITEDKEIHEVCKLDVIIDEMNSTDVTHILNTEHREAIKSLIDEYKPQKTKLKMTILLKHDEPVYQKARRLSPIKREQVNTQIEWIREGIVQPSLSEYGSPVVLTRKKNGSIRLCVDYRQLNKKIIKDRYPLPLVEDQIDLLQGAKYFSTLDLKNGFFHVYMDEQSRKVTAFIVPDGHYEFLRVPFGLCNSPAVF